MGKPSKIYKYKELSQIATRFKSELKDNDYVLLYAYNGTGKTRLSMSFKDIAKKIDSADTLYYNAFTEDLFSWDNDLENDKERVLKINSESKFFDGFRELNLNDRIFKYLERYAEFNFYIDYDDWEITFRKQVIEEVNNKGVIEKRNNTLDKIKISRGEENIFIWCIFLALCELIIDEIKEDKNAYSWVKYIYIDDPISSLDDNNAIAVAVDLAKLLKDGKDKIKVVISSHHHLFFNVMCNELKGRKASRYFLHKNGGEGYTLRSTDETPFFHHVALLSELKQARETDTNDNKKIKTYHFNMLRSILEKTSTFFGYNDFSKCIEGIDDEVLYTRALNLLSHGDFSIYEPVDMGDDTKDLFIKVFDAFTSKYKFYLPEILIETEQKK